MMQYQMEINMETWCRMSWDYKCSKLDYSVLKMRNYFKKL